MMNVALPILMFLVGFAAGGGVLWFLSKKSVAAAREQERTLALGDIRVAVERTSAKEAAITELRADILQKARQLEQRGEENVQLKQQHAVLQTSLHKEQEKIQEKIGLLGQAETQLKEAFKALAADALKNNTEEFREKCKPVEETLRLIDTKISMVNQSAKDLEIGVSKFVKVLQRPEVRGQWGEMHLERVLEITGMSDRCDFCKQQVIGEDGNLRPDVVINLPGSKHIAVDAKATLQAFLDLVEAPDEEAHQAKLQDFVAHVRERIKLLGSKAYYQSLDGSPEFVVLYLPTEGLFSTALTLDADLLEYAEKQRVLLAGPINLIALLRSVAYGWKQDDVATNAREICKLAGELYSRLAVFGGHMTELGKQLDKSVGTYNSAVGSLERNVMPQARKVEQLGAAPADSRMEQLTPIDTTARRLQSPDFRHDDSDGELEEADTLAWPR
jgi:DNA recombination protein RmuC